MAYVSWPSCDGRGHDKCVVEYLPVAKGEGDSSSWDPSSWDPSAWGPSTGGLHWEELPASKFLAQSKMVEWNSSLSTRLLVSVSTEIGSTMAFMQCSVKLNMNTRQMLSKLKSNVGQEERLTWMNMFPTALINIKSLGTTSGPSCSCSSLRRLWMLSWGKTLKMGIIFVLIFTIFHDTGFHISLWCNAL